MNTPCADDPLWFPTPPDLRLSVDHLDVWQSSTSLSEQSVDYFKSLLSESERGKADRFRDPAKRIESQISRGILRHLLGVVLNVDPRGLVFQLGSQGKPFILETWQGHGVAFNISHTRGCVLIAMGLNRDIGADAEWISPDMEWEPVARHFYSQSELASLEALSSDQRRGEFYRMWVRKEARLKATGIGISEGLADPATDRIDIASIQFQHFELEMGDVVVALATTGRVCSLRCWKPCLP